MTNFKVSDEEFSKIVSESTSVAQVISKCGLVVAGGNYQTINRRIKNNNLDTSHFTKQLWNKGKTFPPKRPITDYLEGKALMTSHALRLRLLKEGYFDPICQNCGLSTWLNQPIPLELHHIDGNHKNNSLSNLQILCPNCHAQTKTYRGKNISK